MAIQQKEGCHFDEMMMIGDRYNVDIKPLEDLGGHGVLVQNTNDIVSFFKSF